MPRLRPGGGGRRTDGRPHRQTIASELKPGWFENHLKFYSKFQFLQKIQMKIILLFSDPVGSAVFSSLLLVGDAAFLLPPLDGAVSQLCFTK